MNATVEKFKGLGYELRRVQREAGALMGQADFWFWSEEDLEIQIKCIGDDEFVMLSYYNHGILLDLVTGMGGAEVARVIEANSWDDAAFEDMQHHVCQGDVSADVLKHLDENVLDQLVGDARDLTDKGQEVLVMAKLLR